MWRHPSIKYNTPAMIGMKELDVYPESRHRTKSGPNIGSALDNAIDSSSDLIPFVNLNLETKN
jgi:hypothetical protein